MVLIKLVFRKRVSSPAFKLETATALDILQLMVVYDCIVLARKRKIVSYGTREGTFLFKYLPEKKSKQKELERKSKQ